MGANITRTLLGKDHEVVIVEVKPTRADALQAEFGHRVVQGDGTELYVLERAGMTRPPDLVLALTGDDEDNLVISQLSRERYGVKKIIARVNDPRNQEHFDLLGRLAHDLPDPADHGPDRARGTAARRGPPARPAPREPGDHRDRDRPQVSVRGEVGVDTLGLPVGSRLISVVRDGKAVIAVGDTVLAEGDQVLAILEPGAEGEVRELLMGR